MLYREEKRLKCYFLFVFMFYVNLDFGANFGSSDVFDEKFIFSTPGATHGHVY
jgi:hypothetical protein